MSRFRALLLGVAEYDDTAISSLPCVTSDINQLSTAFEARGYTVKGTGSPGRIGRSELRREVREFLKSAKADDTLVVYLSGHGAYHDSVTYLIPTDADLGDEMDQTAVSLGAWGNAIEDSKAAAVLFLVDACREGYTETKSVTHSRWSGEKTWFAQRRHVAWVFPCAEGQVSRWIRADGAEVREPFSLFARALLGTLSNPAAPRTLDGLDGSLQANMDALTAKYGKPRQEIRVLTNGRDRTEPLCLFPGGSREAQTWEEAAAGHPVWQRITQQPDNPQTPGNQALADSVVSLVRHLDGVRQRADAVTGADPWAERGGFALRMSRQLSFLLSSVLSDLSLSPAEAALLAAAPFAYEAHWAGQLARAASRVLEADGTHSQDPLRASFDRYIEEFPRLRRWAGNLDSHPALAWWLLHRWFAGQPAAYAEDQVAGLLDPDAWGGGRLAAEVLSAARLRPVLQAIREASGFFAVDSDLGGLAPEFTVCEGRPGEQPLRERLVAILLAVAYRMAIEAPFLPDVIADTLGTPDPMVPGDLRGTLDESTWGKAGDRIRVLDAACTHPAAEVALREHVAEFDGLLTHLQAQARQPGLGALGGLPFRALADRVRPADRDGKPAYDSAGTRFRLAEDKVQELLMGEQLYGQATAAIRELYQNALDACRYRKARTEYLNRTAARTAGQWEGRIRFVRGDENGREYLDCIDNGIGMGRRELTEVFARAGVRFAELPEFLAERHEWDKLDPPVEFVPNSRFGVGVLSYFMMADEIRIDTCRFGRDGQLGERLRVHIAGPGALFRIQPAGPGQESGTTVRLYLNPAAAAASCAAELREWLKVAEFTTKVTEHRNTREWKPGELLPSEKDPSSWNDAISAGGSVWWLADSGKLLIDGILTDSFPLLLSTATPSGAIVNLTSERVRLSVDRRRIISLSDQVLDDHLRAALPVLITAGHRILSLEWLWLLARQRPAVADWLLPAVLEKESARSLSSGQHLDLAIAGCFCDDMHLLENSGRLPAREWLSPPAPPFRAGMEIVPDEIAAWRLASLIRAGVTISGTQADSIPAAGKNLPLLPALPSDYHVLRISDDTTHSIQWLKRDAPVPAGHVFAAAESLHRPVAAVCDRLRQLGYAVPDEDALLADRVLASRNLDGKAPWRTSPAKVTVKEILLRVLLLDADDVEIAGRLRRLGYDASPVIDTVLANGGAIDGDSWLSPGDRIGASQVLLAARSLGMSGTEVASRYGALGFDATGALGSLDLIALDAGDGRPLWKIGRGRIRGDWVSRAAGQLRMSRDETTRRLRGEGFVVLDATPDPYLDEAIIGEIGEVAQRNNVVLRNQYDPVDRAAIVELAARSGQRAARVAADLQALGFIVPSVNDLGVVDEELRRMCAPLAHPSRTLPGFSDRPLLPGSVFYLADHIGRPVDYTADRLRSAGYEVPGTAALTDEDRFLVSLFLNGAGQWLPYHPPVTVWQLAVAAIKLDRDPHLIARRLRELGYTVPEGWG